MRTAQICPTCATYTNAKCIIYDGPFLTNSGISPSDNLEYALGLIDGQLGVLANNILTILNNPPSLQSVTDIGNVTTNSIEIGNQLIINDSINGYGVTFDASTPGLSDDRTYSLPDDSGTIALTSDIPEPGWGLTGNVGTNPSTNFIGTTDNQDLVFKRNNVEYLTLGTIFGCVYTTKNILSQAEYPSIKVASYIASNQSVALKFDSTVSATSGYIEFSNNGNLANLKADNINGLAKNIQLPNADGTLQLGGYKSYVAKISQTGTSAPTPDYVLYNDISSPITFSYSGVGIYTINCSEFSGPKTYVSICQGNGVVGDWVAASSATGQVYIYSANFNGTPGNGRLNNANLEIRVYP